MGQATFLLLSLTLFNLHVGQATTCQGDNCPTGLVITGGKGAETSIETFPVETDCSIPPFPEPGREGHSLSVIDHGRQLVACGGYNNRIKRSCISWRHGQEEGWKDYHTLSKGRSFHAAVVMQDESIVIVGGPDGPNTEWTGEIVPSGTVFNLQNGGRGTCAVKFQQELVMIGGCCDEHGKVDRYDSQGNHTGSLPDLGTARWWHACATFISSNGEEGLLVAGGLDAGGKNAVHLASTEIYLPSTGRWTSGGNLPRALIILRAAHLNQRVVVTGGTVDRSKGRNEVLEYDGSTWSEKKETMQTGRWLHAIVAANLPSLCPAMGPEPETLTTEAQDTAGPEQDEVKRLIAEQFEEQKRFIAEQFAEQKRFIAEKCQI